MFDKTIIESIKRHAISEYPNESCGVVTDQDGYSPLLNRHPDPRHHYNCAADLAPYVLRGTIRGLVHSHPDGPDGPSAHDVAQQIAMAVPFGLLMCNSEEATEPFWWGDSLPVAPLEGRPFRHGPSGTDGRGDCYALIRDWYRLERGITLPDFPRDWDWWTPRLRQSLYEENFAKAGFVAVDKTKPEPGDVMLMRYPSTCPVANHGAVFLGNQLMIHHLQGRLSVVAPSTPYMRFVVGWLRYAA